MVALASTLLLALFVQSVSQHVGFNKSEVNCSHSPTHEEDDQISWLQLSMNMLELKVSELDHIPPLGLVAVHKCASTTLNHIVQSLGVARNMSMMVPADGIHMGWPKPFPGAENINNNGLPRHQYQIISNHAIFNETNWRAYLGHDPVFITVLREPVGQAISSYNYFNVPGRESWTTHIDWLKHLPLEVEQNAYEAHFRNPQAYDMGWYEYVGWTAQYDYNESVIKQWLSTLDGPFNRMGSHILQDFFDEGLVLLKRRLKVDIKELSYVRANKGIQALKVEPTEKEREQLKRLLFVDTLLYEHFNKTFAKLWQRGNKKKQQENKKFLAQLKQANTEYEAFCASLSNGACNRPRG